MSKDGITIKRGMDMYNIGICDDERGTCAELEDIIYAYGEKKGISFDVSVWYTGECLCDYLKEDNTLDMLFLDINLNSTDGIKVGKFIREEIENLETAIIFISSESSYAMNLFKIQPFDFLIKPLKSEAIEEVLDRIIKLSRRKNQIFEHYAKGYYIRVPYKEIIYFSSRDKKINIVLKEKEMQFNGKLKELAKRVPHNFIQIHQSYLINIDFVEECTYELVKMPGGSILSISQPYRKGVREHIMQYKWEKMR